jgi:exosortase/archaeosortase family protein
VAGAAYYLLFMLNLSVPKIKVLRRMAILSIAFISFFIVNILRIFFLSVIYYYDFPFSDIVHEFSWYFGSIILTVGIWFSEVYLFKIKEIPFYSDLNYFYKRSIFNKK